MKNTLFCCLLLLIRKYIYISIRAYSRPLLGAIIAPNIAPWVFKKVFSFEMIKNNICLGGKSKQSAFFFEKCAPKNTPMPPLSRIGSVYISIDINLSFSIYTYIYAYIYAYMHIYMQVIQGNIYIYIYI